MSLDLTQKRTIDYLTPTIGSAILVSITYKKNKDWRIILLFFLLGWVVLYIISSRITKMIYESGPSPVPTGGGCDAFDPTSFTDSLQADIYSKPWVSRKVQPYKDLISLADCQLIKVWNDWNARYFKLDKENLKMAMAGEITGIEFDMLRNQLFTRFKTLGLG